MRDSILQRANRWLLPMLLILFILQVVMLPWAVDFTWADRSESPGHVLTYTKNKLTWDSATGIRPDGTAELNLFDTAYDGTVQSANGNNVVAPGTDNELYVRLKNNVSGTITYTAVLYEIDDADIPVDAALTGTGFTDTSSYPLPDGVSASQVLREVTGTVKGGQIQDFDLDWLWEYYISDSQDAVDTMLGNRQSPDELTVGLYIVVEDENSYVTPDIPKTGDESSIGLYIGLMAISFILLVLLLWDRRREAKREGC